MKLLLKMHYTNWECELKKNTLGAAYNKQKDGKGDWSLWVGAHCKQTFQCCCQWCWYKEICWLKLGTRTELVVSGIQCNVKNAFLCNLCKNSEENGALQLGRKITFNFIFYNITRPSYTSLKCNIVNKKKIEVYTFLYVYNIYNWKVLLRMIGNSYFDWQLIELWLTGKRNHGSSRNFS